MEHETSGGRASELERITTRLETLASELDGDPDEERSTELVREASELAAQAGRAVERALRAAAEPGDDEPAAAEGRDD
jgi:hypothetical protein